MFIQTEATPDPAILRFLPGREVLATDAITFRNKEDASTSPLVERLFAVAGVAAVTLDRDSIAVTQEGGDWRHLKPVVLGVIMEHFMSGAPILRRQGPPPAHGDAPEGEAAGRIRTALRQVIDPELGYNIVDLGLVYDVVVGDGGAVTVVMTTTTPGCPATNYLKTGAGEAASSVEGVEFVDVQLTYEPRWMPGMMTQEAKDHFGIQDDGGW